MAGRVNRGGGGSLHFTYTLEEEARFQRQKLQRQMLPMVAELLADVAERLGELEPPKKRTGVLRGRGSPLAAESTAPDGEVLKEKGKALRELLGRYQALAPSGRAQAGISHSPEVIRQANGKSG